MQFEPAGLGSRAAAMIIDQLIITVANVLILIAFIYSASSDLFFFADSLWPIALALIIIFIINYGYFFFAEFYFGGRTIGKKLIGIRVIQENGHNITLLSSFIRNFLRLIDQLPTSYLLGILLVFFHSKHKRLGDMAAGTIVVHERGVKRKKTTKLEKHMEVRGLTKETIAFDEWTIQSLGKKEWDLLKAYSEKLLELELTERRELTYKLAGIILPKVDMKVEGNTNQQLEDILLVLYLHLRDEWEFEL